MTDVESVITTVTFAKFDWLLRLANRRQTPCAYACEIMIAPCRVTFLQRLASFTSHSYILDSKQTNSAHTNHVSHACIIIAVQMLQPVSSLPWQCMHALCTLV